MVGLVVGCNIDMGRDLWGHSKSVGNQALKKNNFKYQIIGFRSLDYSSTKFFFSNKSFCKYIFWCIKAKGRSMYLSRLFGFSWIYKYILLWELVISVWRTIYVVRHIKSNISRNKIRKLTHNVFKNNEALPHGQPDALIGVLLLNLYMDWKYDMFCIHYVLQKRLQEWITRNPISESCSPM